PETLLLLPLLAIPVVWTRRDLLTRRRAALVAMLVLVTGVVLAPWLIRNMTGFSRPVYFSTNGDQVLAVANCPITYGYGSSGLRGYWSFTCNGHLDVPDDAERTKLERDRGVRYLRS